MIYPTRHGNDPSGLVSSIEATTMSSVSVKPDSSGDSRGWKERELDPS